MRAIVVAVVFLAHSELASSCTKLQPTYSSHSIPPHSTVGPFGTVCEVRTPDDIPQIPKPIDKDEHAWMVRSQFPDSFMATSSIPLVEAEPAPEAEPVVLQRADCGSYGSSSLYVSSAAATMDEQVWGISGSADWEMACQACGTALQSRIGAGWYCERNFFDTGIWLKRSVKSSPSTVTIDATNNGQEILGFGGAITDAVAHVVSLLPASLASSWLSLYYGDSGIGYSFGRVPFGGCDFSRRAYSLDPSVNDLNLTKMCLIDDRETPVCGEDAKIPIVLALLHREPQAKLFFSPWSPPKWMKSSDTLVGGRLKGLNGVSGGPEYVEAYADSYLDFVALWEAQNVTFWGFTVQNEPDASEFVSWNSLYLSGADEKALLEILGPKMKAKYPNLKIMVHDDQLNNLHDRLEKSGDGILDLPYVDGIAYHWYSTMAGSIENTGLVKIAGVVDVPEGGGKFVKEIYDSHIKNTSKFMLATEACNGYVVSMLHTAFDIHSLSNNRGVRPGDWFRGVRYSIDIYWQLRNGAAGWVDWNLILDSQGGPNWAGNNVDAPVLVGMDNSSLWLSPMYFHLAHWAKYVLPGSKTLSVTVATSETKDEESSELKVAAFLRPDDKIAVVIVADAIDGRGTPPPNQKVNLVIKTRLGTKVLSVDVTTRSISTILIN